MFGVYMPGKFKFLIWGGIIITYRLISKILPIKIWYLDLNIISIKLNILLLLILMHLLTL